MELDRTDFALVTALQQDASQRLEDLARLVGMAPSSVHERLRRLERSGVIRRWTIDVDAEQMGLPVLAFIGLRLATTCGAMQPVLEVIPEIEECHSVAGAMCMMLKVRVASTSALLGLIDRLREIPGVESTETTVVLATRFDRPFTPPSPTPPAARTRARTNGVPEAAAR